MPKPQQPKNPAYSEALINSYFLYFRFPSESKAILVT